VGCDVGEKDKVGTKLVVGDEESVGAKVGTAVITEVGSKDIVGTKEEVNVGD